MDDPNVHFLGCFQNDLILTLEHVLEKARAGEVNALFIAGTLRNTDVIGCSILDDDASLYALIGRLEAGKIEMIAKEAPAITCDIDYRDDGA